MKYVYVLLVTIAFNSVYAQEWVPYNSQNHTFQQTTNFVQQVPVQVVQPQPVVMYQYVPYIVNQPVVIEKRCFFHSAQRVTYVPIVQYYYQPVILYR